MPAAVDLAGRLRDRVDLLDDKLSGALDVGEIWVNRHIQIWKSYVQKPANKLHANVERRTKRARQTLDGLGQAFPFLFH